MRVALTFDAEHPDRSFVGVDELDLPAGLTPRGEPRPTDAVGAR